MNIMNKIKVTGKREGDALVFYSGEKEIAYIKKDVMQRGLYVGQHGSYAFCSKKTFPEALVYIIDSIEHFFAELGIEVETCCPLPCLYVGDVLDKLEARKFRV